MAVRCGRVCLVGEIDVSGLWDGGRGDLCGHVLYSCGNALSRSMNVVDLAS